ncbi:hypothetical protein CLV35_1414 [Motilibacter peucedani]|uniref:Vitamin K-dependent gamma-carboxylase-like protein n=1 Tax=Motilibacter peucedani TaxID=598650 RepID=A0A420XS41_9ACTN|nr:MFS transporter permease [Motilibacter peucedani]RKS77716.1 hypothetical protein CLV35_1414 [Motilibacter peucedani]
MNRVVSALVPALPRERVAALRWLVYLFIPVDVLLLHTWGDPHGSASPDLYTPLVVGDLLHLPTPSVALVDVCKYGSAVAALLALTGRAPRLLGWTVFALWGEYQVIAFSYGKVDHDRFDLLIALAVLPTVGRLRVGRTTGLPHPSEAAGWALRCIQLAVVATYFLAGVTKVRFGGWGWVDSATLARAVVRRGTFLSNWMLDVPWTLHVGQYVILAFELLSPVALFLPLRWQVRVVAFWLSFHLATYAGITIMFWPHIICLAAFLPLERWWTRLSPPTPPPAGREYQRAAAGAPASAPPPA